jgi:hypothetical protein
MNKRYITLVLVAVLFSACGSSSSDTKNNDGKGAIDLAEYFPSKTMNKIFSTETLVGGTPNTHAEYQQIEVTKDSVTTTINTVVTERVLFSDTNITTTDFEDNSTETMYRHVDIKDTLFSEKINSSEETDLGKITTKLEANCKLKSKETKFEKDAHTYSGDLLKIECIIEGTMIYDVKPSLLTVVASDLNGSHEIYNISNYYLQKGLGIVAEIDDDCITTKNLPFIDDRKKDSECIETAHTYKYYLP